MTETVLEPRDMTWLEKGVLGIEWSDGHKAVYPVRYLRPVSMNGQASAGFSRTISRS
jgi:hypothetical protein